MTKEEISKDYAISRTYPKFETSQIANFVLREVEGAFLAGFMKCLELNRETKWHDLRKNPEDLPKINQKVLLQIKDEGRPIMDFYTRYGVWNFTNEYEAIAWCEIPKFEE